MHFAGNSQNALGARGCAALGRSLTALTALRELNLSGQAPLYALFLFRFCRGLCLACFKVRDARWRGPALAFV
jgi:hypothetical protein